MLVSIVFVGYIYLDTSYHIANGLLKVHCGPFRYKIQIQGIKSIKKTRQSLASPALSLDRLEIRYKKTGLIYVSPKEREAFIKLLQRENPSIVILWITFRERDQDLYWTQP